MGDEKLDTGIQEDFLDAVRQQWEDAMLASIGTPPPLSIQSSQQGTITIGPGASTLSRHVELSEENIKRLLMCKNLLHLHQKEAQEVINDPDFKNAFKNRVIAELAKEIETRVAFTKQRDEHSGLVTLKGKVWVFNEQELRDFIQDVLNAI